MGEYGVIKTCTDFIEDNITANFRKVEEPLTNNTYLKFLTPEAKVCIQVSAVDNSIYTVDIESTRNEDTSTVHLEGYYFNTLLSIRTLKKELRSCLLESHAVQCLPYNTDKPVTNSNIEYNNQQSDVV